MRILHISDTHSKFPELKGNFDVVVHSGDWLPDYAVNIDQYAINQETWVYTKAAEIKKWLNGKPFFLSQGNHDFANPNAVEYILRSEGIEAYNIENKIVSYQGTNFYGFPYVPTINGEFNYEKDEQEMFLATDELAETLNKTYIDVLVAHCPIYGVLSTSSFSLENYGNQDMKRIFEYKVSKDMIPSAYLCGHLHSCYGIKNYYGMLVSNAACTQHIISL